MEPIEGSHKFHYAISLILVLLLFTSQYAWLVKAITASTVTVKVLDAKGNAIPSIPVSLEQQGSFLGISMPWWSKVTEGATDSSGKCVLKINGSGYYRAAIYSADFGNRYSGTFQLPNATVTATIQIKEKSFGTITIFVQDAQRMPRGGGHVLVEHLGSWAGLIPTTDWKVEGDCDASGMIQFANQWIPVGNYRITVFWGGTSEGDLYARKELSNVIGGFTEYIVSPYLWFYVPLEVETLTCSSSTGWGNWVFQNKYASVTIDRAANRFYIHTEDGLNLEYEAQWMPISGVGSKIVPIKFSGEIDNPDKRENINWFELGIYNTTCFPVVISLPGHEQLVWINQVSKRSVFADWKWSALVSVLVFAGIIACLAAGGPIGFTAMIGMAVIDTILPPAWPLGITTDMTWDQMKAKLYENGGEDALNEIQFFQDNFRSGGKLFRDLERAAIRSGAPVFLSGGAIDPFYQWNPLSGVKWINPKTWLSSLRGLLKPISQTAVEGIGDAANAFIETVVGTKINLGQASLVRLENIQTGVQVTYQASHLDEMAAVGNIDWLNDYRVVSYLKDVEGGVPLYEDVKYAADIKFSSQPMAEGLRNSRPVVEAAAKDAASKAVASGELTQMEADDAVAAVVKRSRQTEEAAVKGGKAVGGLGNRLVNFIKNYPKLSMMSPVMKFISYLGAAWTAWTVFNFLMDLGQQELTSYAGFIVDVTPFSLSVGGLQKTIGWSSYTGGWVEVAPREVFIIPKNSDAIALDKASEVASYTYPQSGCGSLFLSDNGLLYQVVPRPTSVTNEGVLEYLNIIKVTPNIPASDSRWTYTPKGRGSYPADFTSTGTKWIYLGEAYTGSSEVERECKVALDGGVGSKLVVRSRAGLWQANVPGDKFVLTWSGTGMFYAPVMVSSAGTLTTEIFTIPQEVKVYYATIQTENHAPMAACYLPEPQSIGVQVQLSIHEIVGTEDLKAHLNFPYMFGPMPNPQYWVDPYGNVWPTSWANVGFQNVSWIDWAKAFMESLPVIGPIFKAISDALSGLFSWLANLPNAFLSWLGVPDWLKPTIGWFLVFLLLVILLLLAYFLWPVFVWLLKLIWLLVKFALALAATLILAIPYVIAYLVDKVADKGYHETLGEWIGSIWDWVRGKEGEGE